MSHALANARITALSTEVRPPAVIGPNAVIQLGEALRDRLGGAAALRVFKASGCEHLLDCPPAVMIDERIPARLFQQLWRELPAATASSVACDAGARTGRYILENRIPRPAHIALRMLPRSVASRLLLSAIEKNAWTFAGSGTCRTATGMPATIEIARNPLRMPGGVWHQAVFAQLFVSLVSSNADVQFIAVARASEHVCRFEIRFSA